MRIAHVVRRYSRAEWGGTETVVAALVAEQRRRGDEARVFCTSALQPPEGTREAEAFGYFYPNVPLSATARDALDRKGGSPFAPGLFRAVRAFRPDVIHVHAGGRLATCAIRLAERLGVPSVLSLHGGAAVVPPQELAAMRAPLRHTIPYGGVLDRLLGLRFDPLARASALVCLSRTEERALVARYPQQRVRYLPNGVPPGAFAHRPFERPARILCVSRLDYQKNQLAFLDLLAARPEVSVELIGPVTAPWYRDEILAQAKARGVAGRLTVSGALAPGSDALHAAFARADVFVLPSVHEPFGIVALEAMQHGVPLVASAVGGLVDFVRDGENGLLFNPAEKGALAAAVGRLTPELAARLVAGGLATAQAFAWPNLVASLAEIYGEAGQSLSCLSSHVSRPPSRPHLISILVRCRNDAAFLIRTLDALAAQVCPIPHEVLVCDDASTDETPALLAARVDVRLVPRPAGAYRPGRTLNALVRAAHGEIVVFNNADAVPLDDRWLAHLVAPLVDGAADATFANQLPRPDATPLVRKDAARAFGDGSVSAHWPRFFSLASSAARRDDLLAHPFDEDLLYSEDVEWANRRADFRRRYVPTARVEHSHNYAARPLARRFYGEGYAEAQIFGDPVPGLFRVVGGAGAEAARDAAYLWRSGACSLRALGAAVVRRLVQRVAVWRGRADAAAGRAPRVVSTDARAAEAASAGAASAPRRILFTGVDPAINGGLERFALRAAEVLRAAGCTVEVVRDVPRRLGFYDRVVMQKLPRRLSDLRRLKRRYGARLRFYAHDHELTCLRRHGYDPLRRPCERRYAPFPCRLCALATRPAWMARALTRDLVGFLREMRDVTTFVQGAYMRRRLLANGFSSERLVVVAPFWTDAVRARDDFMPVAPDGTRPLRLLYVGQLIAGKGVRVLLDAVRRLTIPFSLTFVGSGRDEALLKARAAACPSGSVRFAGWQTDLAPFRAAADVLVVPSLWNEPFGMVGPEAQAAGLPVVAFDRGGVGDWLVDGETGLFAEPTAEGLAAALTAMADPARLAAFSRAAADAVRTRFSTAWFLKGIRS